MGRIALAILITVSFVAFSLSNTHHVELSFVVGRPVEIRLIFLMALSFATGVVGTLFYQLFAEAKRRAQHRKIKLQLKKAQSEREGLE